MAVFQEDLSGEMEAVVPFPATAGDAASLDIAGWQAPHDIKLVSVHFWFHDDVTGDNTNTRNFELYDSGSFPRNELGNVDFVTGTDGDQGDSLELYAPADPVAFSQGAQFALFSVDVGTSPAFPGGVLVFRYLNN